MTAATGFVYPLILIIANSSLLLATASAQQPESGKLSVQPIDRLPVRLTKSGSYCLTDDMEYSKGSGLAISVESNDVTIDLNGYTLTGSGGSASTAKGIHAGKRKNITIKNGRISGFYFGIDLRNDSPKSSARSSGHSVSKVILDSNWYFGVRVMGTGCEIRNCEIVNTGGCTLKRHTIPHGVRLVGDKNAMRDCCVRNLRLKLFPDGKGEIVGVHFDAAKNSVFERNQVIELNDETNANTSKHDTTERRFGLWINGGPSRNTVLSVRNNTFAGFTVPIVFSPGADGSSTGNTFYNAADNPVRGKPTGLVEGNRSSNSQSPEKCTGLSTD